MSHLLLQNREREDMVALKQKKRGQSLFLSSSMHDRQGSYETKRQFSSVGTMIEKCTLKGQKGKTSRIDGRGLLTGKKIIKEENNKLRCFLLNEEVSNSIVYNNNIFQLSTEVEGPVVDKEP